MFPIPKEMGKHLESCKDCVVTKSRHENLARSLACTVTFRGGLPESVLHLAGSSSSGQVLPLLGGGCRAGRVLLNTYVAPTHCDLPFEKSADELEIPFPFGSLRLRRRWEGNSTLFEGKVDPKVLPFLRIRMSRQGSVAGKIRRIGSRLARRKSSSSSTQQREDIEPSLPPAAKEKLTAIVKKVSKLQSDTLSNGGTRLLVLLLHLASHGASSLHSQLQPDRARETFRVIAVQEGTGLQDTLKEVASQAADALADAQKWLERCKDEGISKSPSAQPFGSSRKSMVAGSKSLAKDALSPI